MDKHRAILNPSSNLNLHQQKKIQLPNHKNNFLYDVIMPNIYDMQNIKIIQKHQKNQAVSNSSNNPVMQMKKSKIQKKIQAIVKKNSQQESYKNSVSSAPKIRKYTKQNVKKISKFSQEDKYKNMLLSNQFTIDKMILTNNSSTRGFFNKREENLTNNFTNNSSKFDNNKYSQMKNKSHVKQHGLAVSQTFQQQEQVQNPYVIQFDEAIGEMRKMEQQNFQPFKQKITKIIQKTIGLGVNGNVNSSLQKVNFYLNSMSSPKTNTKYKNIIVNTQERDKKIKSYCQQIQRGQLLKKSKKSSRINSNFTDQNKKQMSQMKKHQSCLRLNSRPFTASGFSNASRIKNSRVGTKSQNFDNMSTNHKTKSLSSSRTMLNRYTLSSAQFNTNKQYLYSNLDQKNRLNSLLQQIQSTCWQSQVNKTILSRKINKMNQQWNIDSQGYRVYENKKMNINQNTLKLIKRQRQKADQVQKLEQSVMNQ